GLRPERRGLNGDLGGGDADAGDAPRAAPGGAAERARMGVFHLGCDRGGPDRRDVPTPAAGECRRGGTSAARPAGRITEFLDLGTSGARFVSRRRNMERLLVVGGWRSLSARTVRDREAPGSNPGPPTSSDFKWAFFGQLRVAGSRAGHTFVGKPSQMGA